MTGGQLVTQHEILFDTSAVICIDFAIIDAHDVFDLCMERSCF